MNADCPHEQVSQVGPPFMCFQCAAVRDSLEAPWRALTDREFACNKVLGNIAGAFMRGKDAIIFNGDTPACIVIDTGDDVVYEIQIYKMAKQVKDEVPS